MTNKLLVLAGLGHFRAFRLDEQPTFSHPRLQFLEEWDSDVAEHLSEELTDQAGRFRRGSVHAGPSDMSDGEPHNLELERRRRALRKMARRIGQLVMDEKVESCYLAAGTEINEALLEELDQPVRGKIEKNVRANLTRLPPDEVLQHFCE